GKAHVESLALFVPAKASGVARARMAHLARGVCKWRLFEVDERGSDVQEMDCGDAGNIETRLVHCADPAAARERFQHSIQRVQALAPETEVAIVTPGEIAFR